MRGAVGDARMLSSSSKLNRTLRIKPQTGRERHVAADKVPYLLQRAVEDEISELDPKF